MLEQQRIAEDVAKEIVLHCYGLEKSDLEDIIRSSRCFDRYEMRNITRKYLKNVFQNEDSEDHVPITNMEIEDELDRWYDMDSKIIKELITISLWLSNKKQKAYYESMISDAKIIHITPMNEVFDKDTIKRIKRDIKPRAKECFKNATLLCQMFPKEAEYVEGKFTILGCYSTDHAWNKIGDKYVDITMELALKRDPKEEEYVSLGEYKESDIIPCLLKNKVYGNIYVEHFLNNYGKNIQD